MSSQATVPAVESSLLFPSSLAAETDNNHATTTPPKKPWGVLFGSRAGQDEYLLVNRGYTIGRHRTADIVVDAAEVSNMHCRVYRRPDDGQVLRVESHLFHKLIDIPKDLIFHDLINYPQSKPRQIDNYYLLDTELGCGGHATVHLAIRRQTGERVACKIIKRPRFLGATPAVTAATAAGEREMYERQIWHRSIRQEVDILTRLNHPPPNDNGALSSVGGGYLMMELVPGGELFDYIYNRVMLPEAETKFIFYQLLLAVKYMHDRQISHRDLKPENILIYDQRPYSRVAITDFGMAKIKAPDTQLKSFCGTLSYIAPEILQTVSANQHLLQFNAADREGSAAASPVNKGAGTFSSYTLSVDCWSLGVILFLMLTGYLPFPDEDEQRLKSFIRRGQMHFDPADFERLTEAAQSLIRHLLAVDPRRRFSVNQAMEHEWIRSQRLELETLYDEEVLRFNSYQHHHQ